MPNVHVETRLLEAEYELLKDFKEKNGLKTDYQGLKELVKALDIPEFHEEIKTEEKKEVKTEVKPIDRTNLENWVKDLGFEQKSSMKGLEAQVGYLVQQMNRLFPNNKIKLGIDQSSGFLNLVRVYEGGTIDRIVSADSKRDMQNILSALQNYTNLLLDTATK